MFFNCRQPRSAEEERSRKRRIDSFPLGEGPIPGDPVLEQLLKPAGDTVGVRLLRGMGWKPGQGIGPRLSRRQRRNAAANVRMFGDTLDKSYRRRAEEQQAEDEEEEDLVRYKDFLFAPDDVPEFLARPKDNLFGIGYSGLDRNALLGGSSGSGGHFSLFDEPAAQQTSSKSSVLRVKGRKNLSIRGQAFGVGAYEEEDDDIYHREDMSG